HVRAKPKFAAVPLALRGVLFGAGLSAAAPRECIRRDGRPPLRRDPRAGAERRAVRVGGTRGGVWRERREGARTKREKGRRAGNGTGPHSRALGSASGSSTEHRGGRQRGATYQGRRRRGRRRRRRRRRREALMRVPQEGVAQKRRAWARGHLRTSAPDGRQR
ncbi:unnamed protein product, partial [Prorocentrum cordatum]